MKSISVFIVCFFITATCIAQKDSLDLIIYTPLKGWAKEEKENVRVFTFTDKKDKSWCQVGVFKSTISKGSIEADFESEWNVLAATPYKVTEAPEKSAVEEADGWKIISGTGKFVFNGATAGVIVTTFSGYNRCVSIVATTANQRYLQEVMDFIGSVELKKQQVLTPQSTIIKAPVIGSWGKSNTVGQINNRFGNYSYNKQQYIFNADGSYRFAAKTYNEQYAEILLIKETGNFITSANSITITPKSSVIEAWSKKNAADIWGRLKSTQKRKLETATYQFSITDKNFQLQTATQTERDGIFNSGNTYTYGPPGTFTPIQLPGGDGTTSEEIQKEPVKQIDTQASIPVANSAFAFSTSNFDDGWTSTVQEDWVEVTKGNIKVLLHYPKAGTIFPADPEPMTNAAWDILVAPRYSNLKNYRSSYIATFERPHIATGYVTEKASGKNVFVVFFHRGSSVWMEFVAPDKNAFIQQYKFDPETIKWDSDDALLNPLLNMSGYNKFAVAASDLKGKWTSSFTGVQQMYNVYTGYYAGMNMNQSNEEFVFSGNTYNWKLLVVNGMVGNAKFNQVKSSGTFTMPNNWQLHFTMIENRARTYHAFWSCIKGARILNLLDAEHPGSGIYEKYGLAK